jgi:molybdopterin-containing oxidoreductase family iron-sulfur binding subunit
MNRADREKDQDVGRREFMQLAGFAVGTAGLVGCSRGVEHGVLPYLTRPEEVTPGRAYWYASVCGACAAGCGILAKNRDGRPIKLEGNPDHPLSDGGLCVVGQASVLGLYDSHRLRQPLRGREQARWPEVDREIGRFLETLKVSGGRVRFLTDSATGPAERERIAEFLSGFDDGKLVTYEPLSASAIADAHRQTHGARIVPRYRFDRAEVIVGFGADFLGTWISPVEHTSGYRAGRRPEGDGGRFSYHVQFESRMSLTGSNADRRIAIPPGATALILAHLAAELATRTGSRTPWSRLPVCPIDSQEIAAVADRLSSAPRGRTLVVCGENDVATQRLNNYVNHLLGNYEGTTLDVEGVSNQRLGDDGELEALVDELEAGQVDALFVRGVNPVYDLPDGERIAERLERVGLVVSFAANEDETSRHAHFVCPEPHYLESWGDAEPVAGLAAVRQPTIRPVGSTRPLLESLATWSANPATAYDLLRDSWRRNVYPRRQAEASFEEFWNRALHDGIARVHRKTEAGDPQRGGFELSAVTTPREWTAPGGDELLLVLHPSATVTDGRHADNPWLQEVPDPIAKTVWDNFAAIAPAFAEEMAVATGDVVRITPSEQAELSVELPVLVQPGQHPQAVAIALGYGRTGTDRFAKVGPQWWEGRPTVEQGRLVGVNAAPLLAWADGSLSYGGRRLRVEKTGRRRELATTQTHHSLLVPEKLVAGHNEPRPIVQETTLAAWRSDPGSGGGHGHHELASLWPDHPKSPHHWGLAIDLTACTGCSACVVACQAENNIPVVGKDEVHRAREMHWMRIDRYYSGEGSDVDVVHMPMMCQHCDNAPCETVCPVQATAQSAEGLNQQVYNRCVGTRYCANNCPYKVRRFNWFNYPREDRLQNLALNPDVTVRSRGVMEKCSLCVQRIQDGKAEARRAGRPLQDGEIQPACAQSCPAGAIVFGDMNDPESRVARQKHDPRHYVVLEELGVKPVVGYLRLLRNRRNA